MDRSPTSRPRFDDLKSYGGDANEIVIGCDCEPRGDSPIMTLEGPTNNGAAYLGLLRPEHRSAQGCCPVSWRSMQTSTARSRISTQLQPQLYSCRVGATVRGEDNVDAEILDPEIGRGEDLASARRRGREGSQVSTWKNLRMTS